MERLSRGRAQRIASSRAKWNDNGLKMLPRGLPNRSKIAPRWLPGGSRAPPESANGSGDLSCSFFGPLGRLSGRSWVALGRSWRSLGASWAVPGPPGALLGAIFVTQGPPLGPVWVSFSDAFGKHGNLDFRRQLQRKSRLGRPRGVQNRAKMAPKSLLGASWRLLALSWRLSALSLASLGGLLAPLAASWASLGALLKRF